MSELKRAPYFFAEISQDRSVVRQLASSTTTLVGLDGRERGAAARFPGFVSTIFGSLAGTSPSFMEGFVIQKGSITNKLRGIAVFDGKNITLLYHDTTDGAVKAPHIVRSNFGGGSGSGDELSMTSSGKFLYFANAGFSTTVDVDSAIDQGVLSVAATDAFAVGDIITIGRDTAREEETTISSISAGVSITVSPSLKFAHTAAQADVVEGGSLPQKPLVVWHDGTDWQSSEMGPQEEDGDNTFSASTTGTGGLLTDGTYHVAYRKVNPDRNVPSGLTTVQTITISAGTATQKITTSAIAQDTVFSKVELYRSVSASDNIAGGTLYLEGTLDISGGSQTPVWGTIHDGQIFLQDKYHVKLDAVKFPPSTNRIHLYESSMFMKVKGDVSAQDSISDIQWSPSHTFSPEVFPTSNIFRMKSSEGPVLKWVETGDFLFGITPTVILRIQKSGTRIAISKNPVGTGPISRSATVGFGNSLMTVTPRGMFFVDGTSGKVNEIKAVSRIIRKRTEGGWYSDIVADEGASLPNIHVSVDESLGAIFIVNNAKQEAIVFWLSTGRITMLRNFSWVLSTSMPHPIDGGPTRAFFYGVKKIGDNVASGEEFAHLDRLYSVNLDEPSSKTHTMLGFDKGTDFDISVNGTATGPGSGATLEDLSANFGPEVVGSTANVWIGGPEGVRTEKTIVDFGTSIIDDDFNRADNASLGPDYTESEAVGVTVGTDNTFGSSSTLVGAASTFVPNTTQISSASLSNSKFVVAYSDINDSNVGKAKIGTISGTDITFGAESEFLSPSSASEPVVVVLSSTKFVVLYRDATASRGKANVGTISGTDITFGAEETFLAASSAHDISASKLSSTTFIVAYREGAPPDDGFSQVGTVSGTDVSFGSSASFNGPSPEEIFTAGLSATKFVVVYRDNAGSGHGTARIGTVSGTDITYGADAKFLADSSRAIRATSLSDTIFIVVYRDVNAVKGKSKLGTVSGTTITFGSDTQFDDSDVDVSYVQKTSSTTFALAYADPDDSSHGVIKVGTVSGTSINYSAEAKFFGTGVASAVSIASMSSSTTVVISYRDGNTLNGVSVVANIPSGDKFSSVSMLDSTHVIVAWSFAVEASVLMKVGTISGDDITWGPTHTAVTSILTTGLSLTALSSTVAVVGWGDSVAADGRCAVATISGTDVTTGSAILFNGASTTDVVLEKVDATKFLVSYTDSGSTNGEVRHGTVSGTDVTYGLLATHPGSFHAVAMASLSATVFVAYSAVSQAGWVLTVSGTTISTGLGTVISGLGTTTSSSLAAIDATHVALATHDSGDDTGNAYVGTVAAAVLTWGDEQEFRTSSLTPNVSLVAPSSSTLLVSYGLSDGSAGSAFSATSGDSISWDSEFPTSSVLDNIKMAALSSSKVFMIFRNTSDAFTGQVLDIVPGSFAMSITLDANQVKMEHNGAGADAVALAIRSDMTSPDYEVSARYTDAGLSTESVWSQIYARKVDLIEADKSSYVLTFARKSGTADGLTISDDGTLAISVRDPSGTHAVLASMQTADNGVPFKSGQQYKLRMRIEGTTLRAWVDDVFMLSVTDGTITAAGNVAIGAASAANTIDRILVDDFKAVQDLHSLTLATPMVTSVSFGDLYSISCIPFDIVGPMVDRRGGGADDLFISRILKSMNSYIDNWDNSGSPTVNSRFRYSSYVEGSTTESSGADVAFDETPWNMYAQVLALGLVVQPGWSTYGSDEPFELIVGQVGYETRDTARAGK